MRYLRRRYVLSRSSSSQTFRFDYSVPKLLIMLVSLRILSARRGLVGAMFARHSKMKFSVLISKLPSPC